MMTDGGIGGARGMAHPGSMTALVRILRKPPAPDAPRFADMIAGNLDPLLIAAVNGMADPSDRARRRRLVRRWRGLASADGGRMPAIALVAIESLILSRPFDGCHAVKERIADAAWTAGGPEAAARAMARIMWGAYGIPGCGISALASLAPAAALTPGLPGPDDGTVISWMHRASSMVQSLSEALPSRPPQGIARALADLAAAAAGPGAPGMVMRGGVTAGMLADPVDMILDGLPTMMAAETMAAETMAAGAARM